MGVIVTLHIQPNPRLALACLIIFVSANLCSPAHGDDKSDKEYRVFLQQFDDTRTLNKLDWAKLRMLFAKTSFYAGNGSDTYMDLINATVTKTKVDHKALKKKTDDNFPMWLGHALWAGKFVKGELKGEEGAREVVAFIKLKEAVLSSGTGNSADQAYIALSDAESIYIVKELGFVEKSQALMQMNGKTFDVYTAYNDKARETKTIWVDISSFYGR